jgi:hypothetical protein
MSINDPIGIPVWLDETLAEIGLITSAKIKALGGTDLYKMINKIKRSPRKQGWFERVKWSDVDLRPLPVPDEEFPNITSENQLFEDQNTGLKVVREDDGTLFREIPYPPGSTTIADIAKLSVLLWRAAERAANAAESGLLTQEEREQAVKFVDAADDLEMFSRLLTNVDKRRLFDTLVSQLKKRPEYRRSQIGLVKN